MSSVAGLNSATRSTTSATTTATPAAPTAAVGSNPRASRGAASADVVGDPNASGASKTPVRKAGGLPASFDASKLAIGGANGAVDGMTGKYIARPTATYFVGYGDITRVAPTTDGFEIDIHCYTNKPNDEIALILQLPLRDAKSGKLTYFNLDVLTHDPAKSEVVEKITTQQMTDPVSGKQCYGGRRTYRFSLAQINEFIKSQGLDVALEPGHRLTISGLIKGDGHRVMNAASNGFKVPRPLGHKAASPVSVQAANMTGKAASRAEDLPLDISVKLPQDVLDQRVYLSGSSLRVGDIIEGEITTRLESEYKGSLSPAQMDAALDRAYELATLSEKWLTTGDKQARAELDKLLGKDLVLKPVVRHWLGTDGKPVGSRDPASVTIQRDGKGRPMLDPMKDQYSDDKALTMANVSGVVRVRSNAQKGGHFEVKINGGVLDPKTGIRQRVETSISLKPGASEADLKKLFKYIQDNPTSNIAMSQLGHIVRESKKAGVDSVFSQASTTWAVLEQIRHKFEIENVITKTSGELSLDHVKAETARQDMMVNGQPQKREYFVIETELDHMQINAKNAVEAQEVKSKAALTTPAAQAEFVAETKKGIAEGKVALEVLAEVELHSQDHVKEGSFRKTPSYKDFEDMNGALLKALFGKDMPGPARQKSAHFAELLGLVKPEQTTFV